MLKPGGICVYSTCSISTIENENVVEKFSNQVRFHTQKSPGIISKKENKLLGRNYYHMNIFVMVSLSAGWKNYD